MTGGAGNGARRRTGRQCRGGGARRRRRDGSGGGAGRDADMGRVVGLEPAPVAPAQASSTTDAVAALPQADAADTALTRERVRLVAVVRSPDACTLCEACLGACVREAITLTETPVVDARLCTGCGACEDACPNDVFALAEV